MLPLRFNTQPPKGGWVAIQEALFATIVSTHSRLKAAGIIACVPVRVGGVSTHSRLKAAGQVFKKAYNTTYRFNTQPPKGGWGYIEAI